MPMMSEDSLVNQSEKQPEVEEKTQPEEVIEEVVQNEVSEEKPVDSTENKESEEEATEEGQTYEVKWKDASGKDVIKQVSVDELTRDYQLKQASYAKFQEAKKIEESTRHTLQLLKKDPIGAHAQQFGIEATREYLWNALTEDNQQNIIDKLIEVYGPEKIQPIVVNWVNKVMEDEHLKMNNPQEYNRKQQQKHEEKQFLTERQKVEAEKRELEEWKRNREQVEASAKQEAQAKTLFTEIQSAATKAKLPGFITIKDEQGQPKKQSIIGIVAKYMEIYENAEGREVSAEETVQRMREDFLGFGLAEANSLPEGELLSRQPELAKKISQGIKQKISGTRSTKPKHGEHKPLPSKNAPKVIGNVQAAPWRKLGQ